MRNRNILVTSMILLGVFFLSGCTDAQPQEIGVDEVNPTPGETEFLDEEISVAPDQGITADDVLNNPDLYEGTVVNLRAEVEEWLNPRAFVLDAPGIVNDNLLVITQDPNFIFEDPELFGDSIWEVTGTVERFELTVATDTLDADLQPDVFTTYEGAPYIEATSVELYED